MQKKSQNRILAEAVVLDIIGLIGLYVISIL